MSNKRNTVQEAYNRSTSSNTRTNSYVIPAQRRTMTPSDTPSASAALTIPVWRRKAQTPTSDTKAATEQALVKASPSTSSTSFKPMDSVQGLEPTFTAEEKVRAGFSWRYKGDIRNPKNSSMRIASDDNCALFLTNLPAGTTPKILLDALGIHAPFGRVYATSIAPPTDGRHSSACAKIAMFTRQDAVCLFQFIAARNLKIAGRTIAVVWNSNRSAPQTDLPHSASRVLEIHGPVEVVDIHRLTRFLESNIKFDTQDITVVREDKHERRIRWTFGSFRAQAQVARKALRAEWPGLHIRWGIDPMSLPIHMVPSVQSTMPPIFHQDEPQMVTDTNDAGDDESIGDLMTFSEDDDAHSDIYGV
ncbi:hypothetical protein B0H65DRAFT_568069 [Neurospora tetraspora]|uniref:RRM domain-containing protein n=1 Tax=Neurospora tetraspora TaxID=94610 RepID=A0AAE0MU49_9PEZI|nr:hypothetical protein B0H65DRAFT_568069 [Neurospora tetraspora]